jgi:hypothetical protein
VWAVTAKTGKRMPFDAELSAIGQWRIEDGIATFVGGEPERLYVSHFATCPNANEHRRSHGA